MKAILLVALLAAALVASSSGNPKGKPQKAQKAAPAASKKAAALPASQHDAQSAQLATHPVAEPVFASCPQGSEWVSYGGSCYRYFEKKPQYWYEAELQCRSYDGHLVSINSRQENAFVGKLTYCRKAWTGAYALDVRKLRDPNNYVWTDGSSKLYNAHNFSAAEHRHKPLVSSENLQWFNHVYHDKQDVVCEVPARNISRTCRCPVGWRYLNDFCYYMPSIRSGFYEAQFFCDRGHQADLTSINDEPELRAMTLLDPESYSCPEETWIGLQKLNPCLPEYPRTRSPGACFRWLDGLKDFNATKFPEWGSPPEITLEKSICVYLKDKKMHTLECHHKRRFVCKKRASTQAVKC